MISFWFLLREYASQIFEQCKNQHVLKMSAALSYYTIFSLPPLIMVLISLLGFFFGKNAAQGEIFQELKSFTGPYVANDIQDLIIMISSSVKITEISTTATIIFFFGATSVFTEIQESLNLIYGVRPQPKRTWTQLIKNRIISFLIILVIGFLLIFLMIIQVLLDLIMTKMSYSFPDFTRHLFDVLNFFSLSLLTVSLFFLMFKFLPDVVISYKIAFRGALFTSLLFLAGKYVINFFLSNTLWSSVYGAGAYLLILLLWVYYSSIIMFIGAEFTRFYALKTGEVLRPKVYALLVQNIEIEMHK